MEAVEDLATDIPVRRACAALSVPPASFYRWCHPAAASPTERSRPPLALSDKEEQAVLDELHSERFVDRAPAEIHATLLEEGVYHCSARTMYRVLHRHAEIRERRNQVRRPAATKPELLATAPNQVWSWDITKLKGPVKWTYFYLYVILDVFSRYVVGWMIAHRESSELARRLIEASCEKQDIDKDQLTLHADRGPSMTSYTVAQLLARLAITKSHSRPYTSNDNPFSEAMFKTVKYHPEFPERFGGIEDAIAFSRVLFPWYNTEHRHAGIGYLTPEVVHYGRATDTLAARAHVLREAFAAHPNRFKHRSPKLPVPPAEVWINPPPERQTAGTAKINVHIWPTPGAMDATKGLCAPGDDRDQRSLIVGH